MEKNWMRDRINKKKTQLKLMKQDDDNLRQLLA